MSKNETNKHIGKNTDATEAYSHVKSEDPSDSLLTPRNNHQRSESSYSRNYSLLDIYGVDSPSVESSPEMSKKKLVIDTVVANDLGEDNLDSPSTGVNTPATAIQESLPLGIHGSSGLHIMSRENKSSPYNSGATDETYITSAPIINRENFDDMESHNEMVSNSDTVSNFHFNQINNTSNTSINNKPPIIKELLQEVPIEEAQPISRDTNVKQIPIEGSVQSDPRNEDHDVYLSVQNEESIDESLASDFDRYGFRKASSFHDISKEEYNEWFSEYTTHLSRRKKKWELLMKSHGLSIDPTGKTPIRFPPKSDRVKKMIRKGLPPEWRGNAWFFYAGGYEKLNKNTGIYDKIVENTTGIENKDTEVIERDLNRTFPDNFHFNKFTGTDIKNDSNNEETSMIKSLRRVLIAFAHYQPQIGYCQSLNFLAGLLLLFMSEEHAFWMLVILTERIIPKVHSANLEGVHTDQGVLMLCVKEYIPQLWGVLGKTFEGETLSPDKILSRLPPVTLVTSSWFMSVFVGVLPFESALRVWDILWYEGSKTIFRISLTICKLCFDHPDFQATRSNGGGSETEQIELFQFMQNFPKTILDPNLLIDNCFKKIGGYGFGSLSQDEINKCREFVSKQRAKLQNKKQGVVTAGMSEEERKALNSSGSLDNADDDIHDIYGFNRSIMSGVAWNRNISNKMKKKFAKKQR
ncbi:hypothetical protein HYPBUDRAFT_151743 [Hyphopichia burtonii NRRL Y-1933]|uniref:Rab-GAP TBC domain-containing protein n=1 Tax=Hyphopichia burtonii NRRL Y-1933 TaxID=984485 RepID=A0A1E4RT16_9ASCO|nr:hypothetical protein HYPBUDRAFT_151743 [Hyphopichia burtonii NRRL Y-1933]ODV70400.1 hypothetical protein HYPBUDRAFT_151743 [Hyphopichia burtonii NRRL Y-1933]